LLSNDRRALDGAGDKKEIREKKGEAAGGRESRKKGGRGRQEEKGGERRRSILAIIFEEIGKKTMQVI